MMSYRFVLAASLLAARLLPAQSLALADSLLRAGAYTRAESLYYAAASAKPRDPVARWALGRYLVSRGAVRVGATLLEEALTFGGEPAIVGRDLAPVYLAIGDFKSLAALGAAPPAERARARWFLSHEPGVVSPDSVLIAAFWPASDSTMLGHIPIRIDGHTVEAAVSSRVSGLLIADSSIAARSLHKFENPGSRGAAGSVVLAAADSVAIGRLVLRNYPVSVGRIAERQPALIGLDMLGHFAPTFDAKGNRMMLRVSGSATPIPAGSRFPTLLVGGDLRVAQGGGWISMMQPQIAHMLRDARWTIDAKRGLLIVEP